MLLDGVNSALPELLLLPGEQRAQVLGGGEADGMPPGLLALWRGMCLKVSAATFLALLCLSI